MSFVPAGECNCFLFAYYVGPAFQFATYETNAVIRGLQFKPQYPRHTEHYICHVHSKLLQLFVRICQLLLLNANFVMRSLTDLHVRHSSNTPASYSALLYPIPPYCIPYSNLPHTALPYRSLTFSNLKHPTLHYLILSDLSNLR